MDTSAYLKRQGWQGAGHSLDQSGRGIRKPLLISKKVDVLGVGLNKHAAVSDQWWLRAFDEGLKNFGTGQESVLRTVQKRGINHGGLYGRFVKGEGVPGTIDLAVHGSGEAKRSPENTPASGFERLTDRSSQSDHDVESDSTSSYGSSNSDAGSSESTDSALAAPYIDTAKMVVKRKRLDDDVGDIKRLKRRTTQQEQPEIRDKPSGGLASGPEHNVGNEGSNRGGQQQGGLRDKTDGAKRSSKAEKYAHEKLKRELKRNAKASNPPSQEKLASDKAKKEKSRLKKGEKKRVAAETRLLRRARRQDKKAKKVATSGQDRATRSGGEREPRIPGSTGSTADNDLTIGTSGEKLFSTQTVSAELSQEKLAKYKKRAAERGVTLEQYIRRRDDKFAAQQQEKLVTAAKPSASFGSSSTPYTSVAPQLLNPHAVLVEPLKVGSLECVVDTTGDDTLLTTSKPSQPGASAGKLTKKAARKAEKKVRKIARDKNKAEALEKIAIKILGASRVEMAAGHTGPMKICESDNVPVIQVATAEGKFSKREMSLARTAARKIMKKRKSAQQAKLNKSKAQKRDRA